MHHDDLPFSWMHARVICRRLSLQVNGVLKPAMAGLLKLVTHPSNTFHLTLDNLTAVTRLAAALRAPVALRLCAAAAERLVAPQRWVAAIHANPADPRYLLTWLQLADATPCWAPVREALLSALVAHYEEFPPTAVAAALAAVSPPSATLVDEGILARLGADKRVAEDLEYELRSYEDIYEALASPNAAGASPVSAN